MSVLGACFNGDNRKLDVIQDANYVAGCASLDYAISSLEQCNSSFYNDLYKSLTGSNVTFNTSSEENRCQILINALELHLSPCIKLTHIRGFDLANLNELSITHMLDVFSILFAPPTSLVLPCESTCPALALADEESAAGTPPCSNHPLSNDNPSLYHSTLHAKSCTRLSMETSNSEHHSENETSCLSAYIRNGVPSILKSLLDSYLQDMLHPSHTSVHRPRQIKTTADVLWLTENQFPFPYVEPSTIRTLTKHQLRQFDVLSKPETMFRSSVSQKISQILQKQQMVMQIVQRDLAHVRCLQETQDKRYYEQYISGRVHTKRSVAARAHRYFRDYELQLKSKLLSARTSEEQTFIKTFENGLKLQRDGVRNARKCTKERQLLIENQVCRQLEAMETYYRDHFAMLSGVVKLERKKLKSKEIDSLKALGNLKTKNRQQLKDEIGGVQRMIFRDNDIQHFRDLDASRIQWKF